MEIPYTLVEALDVTWQQCGGCWGQRVILKPVPGDGFAGESCHHCIGIGERMVVHAGSGGMGGL